MYRLRITLTAVVGMAALVAGCGGNEATGEGADDASDLIPVSMSVLEPPSLTYFLVPLVEELGFDEDNGLEVEYLPKPAGTMRTDFAAGSDKLSAGGTILADVGLLNERGVDTQFLFNAWDFWGAVAATKESGITEIADLPGRTLAAALPTTNYAMFEAVAQMQGVDPDGLDAQGAQPSGLGTLLAAGRIDAVQLWEPAYTIVTRNNPDDYTTIDLAEAFRDETGISAVPYIGIAAHADWAEENGETIERLYDMYGDVAAYIEEQPEEAAQLIGADTDIDPEALTDLFASDRFGMSVYPATAEPDSFEAVLSAAVDSGYLSETPSTDILYDGDLD